MGEVFGFEVFLLVPGEGENVVHVRLTLESNMIMLASPGREGDFDARFASPSDINAVTQSILIVVDDPDTVYRDARAAGARIIDEIEDFEFGGRTFSCQDIEGHLWVFTSHDPWARSEDS